MILKLATQIISKSSPLELKELIDRKVWHTKRNVKINEQAEAGVVPSSSLVKLS